MPVVHWNGTDLPVELQSLPAGDYVVEPAILSTAEESGILAGLSDIRAGRTVSHEDVRRRLSEKRARDGRGA